VSDLELTPTDDLIDELFRRHSAVLIVRQMPVKTTNQDDTLIDYCGGLNTAIGMATRASGVLTAKAARSMEETDEGD